MAAAARFALLALCSPWSVVAQTTRAKHGLGRNPDVPLDMRLEWIGKTNATVHALSEWGSISCKEGQETIKAEEACRFAFSTYKFNCLGENGVRPYTPAIFTKNEPTTSEGFRGCFVRRHFDDGALEKWEFRWAKWDYTSKYDNSPVCLVIQGSATRTDQDRCLNNFPPESSAAGSLRPSFVWILLLSACYIFPG